MTELNAKSHTKLNGKSIIQTISTIFKDDNYTFDAYIWITNKSNENSPKDGNDTVLKKFVLFEGAPKECNNLDVNFKKKLQIKIAGVIIDKYGNNTEDDNNDKYDSIENIADNQNKFYIIPETDEYRPFKILDRIFKDKDNGIDKDDGIENYRVDDITSAKGIFFRYKRDDKEIWAFQHFWPTSISNRKGVFHIISQDDVFVELTKPILVISHKVDLLIINDQIITNDIALLQTRYGFQSYIRASAAQVISKVSKLSFVSNTDKLNDYISQIKLTHAKKVLRLKSSKVLDKTKEELYHKITTLPRWQGKFEINETDHTIHLKTNVHVENLIDLLDERYTRSDITNEEYDTSAKKWIGPVTQ